MSAARHHRPSPYLPALQAPPRCSLNAQPAVRLNRLVAQFPALHVTAVDRPQHRPMATTHHRRRPAMDLAPKGGTSCVTIDLSVVVVSRTELRGELAPLFGAGQKPIITITPSAIEIGTDHWRLARVNLTSSCRFGTVEDYERDPASRRRLLG